MFAKSIFSLSLSGLLLITWPLKAMAQLTPDEIGQRLQEGRTLQDATTMEYDTDLSPEFLGHVQQMITIHTTGLTNKLEPMQNILKATVDNCDHVNYPPALAALQHYADFLRDLYQFEQENVRLLRGEHDRMTQALDRLNTLAGTKASPIEVDNVLATTTGTAAQKLQLAGARPAAPAAAPSNATRSSVKLSGGQALEIAGLLISLTSALDRMEKNEYLHRRAVGATNTALELLRMQTYYERGVLPDLQKSSEDAATAVSHFQSQWKPDACFSEVCVAGGQPLPADAVNERQREQQLANAPIAQAIRAMTQDVDTKLANLQQLKAMVRTSHGRSFEEVAEKPPVAPPEIPSPAFLSDQKTNVDELPSNNSPAFNNAEPLESSRDIAADTFLNSVFVSHIQNEVKEYHRARLSDSSPHGLRELLHRVQDTSKEIIDSCSLSNHNNNSINLLNNKYQIDAMEKWIKTSYAMINAAYNESAAKLEHHIERPLPVPDFDPNEPIDGATVNAAGILSYKLVQLKGAIPKYPGAGNPYIDGALAVGHVVNAVSAIDALVTTFDYKDTVLELLRLKTELEHNVIPYYIALKAEAKQSHRYFDKIWNKNACFKDTCALAGSETSAGEHRLAIENIDLSQRVTAMTEELSEKWTELRPLLNTPNTAAFADAKQEQEEARMELERIELQAIRRREANERHLREYEEFLRKSEERMRLAEEEKRLEEERWKKPRTFISPRDPRYTPPQSPANN